MPYRVWSKSVR